MGHAVIGDVRLGLTRLLELVSDSDRDAGDSLPDPIAGEEQSPITGTAAMHALRQAFPEDGIVVLEAPSSTLALRNQLRLSKPGSYFFGAGGGLGFGLASAVGVQIAQPDRPVVCVVGEGSAQYAITALWSAVAYDVPLTILVLRNSEYAILKWFAMVEQVSDAPGLDLPALDTAAIAAGYGVSTTKVEDADALTEALKTAIASPKPELVEVGVAPGMWLF
jgi:benzoylformate decarboxylase